MKIGIHDSDKTHFPNYALMKISAYHKAQGDDVEWWIPLMSYDKVYSSKVFTFTPEEPMLPIDTIKGGTGYGNYGKLPDEIDKMFPDYSIYPECDYAIGFLTRGCIRKCPWCVVPKKEGMIEKYLSWEEIRRSDTPNIVFMDNNVLACQHGIEQIESMGDAIKRGERIKVDFNQGLDARLITQEIAFKLAALKWYKPLRMACDTSEMLPYVEQATRYLREAECKPQNYFIYALVKDDIVEAEQRCLKLRELGLDPFVQPFRDFDTNAEPTKLQKAFARWVDRKWLFKSCTFYEYLHGGGDKNAYQGSLFDT